MPEDPRPTAIARYQVRAELGHGAMGVVYQARDPQLDRIVAVKTIRNTLGMSADDYATYKRRFFTEAKAAAQLNHPHVVAIYDVMDVDQTPYIVMEYVDGGTLLDLLKATAGALDPRRAVEIVRQICLALDHAHSKGIVHRDIKPANILFNLQSEVKVADFGIARILDQDLTVTRALMGTPSYMSPEHIRGNPVDGRSDVFSLGALLYQTVTGEKPFGGTDTQAVTYSILHNEPLPLHTRDPRVSLRLSEVAARALAKNPQDRYQSARDFADALGHAIEPSQFVTTAAPSQGVTPAPQRPLLRGRQLAFIGVCCVVAFTASIFTLRRHASLEQAPLIGAAPSAHTTPESLRMQRASVTESTANIDRTLTVPESPLVRHQAEPPSASQARAPAVTLRRPSGNAAVLQADATATGVAPRASAPPHRLPSTAPPAVPQNPAFAIPRPSVGEEESADSRLIATPSERVSPPPADTRRDTGRQHAMKQGTAEFETPIALPRPPAQNADTPPVGTPAPPSPPRGDVAGRWQGRYQCQREEIGVSLRITGHDGKRITAVFEFFPLPGTLSSPKGSFKMAGEYNSADGFIQLRSTSWIERPLGLQSHDIEGRVAPSGDTIDGRVLTTGCAQFILARR